MEALPVELIAKIFLIGCEDTRDPNYYPTLSRYRATISCVSSLWRDVALSTSRLWTDIVLSPSDDSDTDQELFFLRLNLERSGGASIDVHLGLPMGPNVNDAGFALLWIPISEQLHRCRSISIHGLSEKTMKTIMPLPGPLTQLEKLDISNPSPYPSHSILASSAVAPKLGEIWLDQVDFHGLSSIPTEHLTVVTLYARYGRGSMFSEFVSRCSALTQLLIIFEFTTRQIRTPPAVVPTLRDVTVSDVRFPRYLSAPGLTHLCCVGGAFKFNDPSMPALESFELSNPPRVLAFKDWDPPTSLADIHTFKLRQCARPDYVFELLLRGFDDDPRPIVFPSLRTLLLGSGVGFTSKILRVLDRRPNLHLQCEEYFFWPSKMTPKDLAGKYGARIDHL